MTIRIEERFVVRAPAGSVWDYLVDPRRVVPCLPGAELAEVIDERTFHGSVKVKVGTVTVSYKGRVLLAELDSTSRRVKMIGEGREATGTGSAKMTLESRVSTLPDGTTDVTVRADLDVLGRIVQLGRGLIEQVAHQLFRQFASCVRATLEAEAEAGLPAAAAVPQRAEPVRAIQLFFRALWAWILSLFRRRRGTKA